MYKRQDWDWTIDPMGLRMCCRDITSRYDLPIVISENGLGAFDKVEDGKIHDCLLYTSTSLSKSKSV